MALFDTKISALPAAASPTDGDLLPIVQNLATIPETRKVTLAALLASRLKRGGDTLDGALHQPAAPSAANHLANKQYVDGGDAAVAADAAAGLDALGDAVAADLAEIIGSLVTAFVQLSDVPSSYTGQAGKTLIVKATEDGLEFGIAAGGGGASVFIGETPPADPTAGDMWFDAVNGELLIWYEDVDSSAWVEVLASNPPGDHEHDASKIVSGILATARIPDLDASKIVSGLLAAARIPGLDASKITTGTMDPARLPVLSQTDKIVKAGLLADLALGGAGEKGPFNLTRSVINDIGTTAHDPAGANPPRVHVVAGYSRIRVTAGFRTSGSQIIARIYRNGSHFQMRYTSALSGNNGASMDTGWLLVGAGLDVQVGDYFTLHGYGDGTMYATADNFLQIEYRV